jgi:NAD(P)-dependent dehydrogenase (short-subunit alcohol dehydrogenase family)
MDDKPLAGQAALITGGGGGIGRASASWLARDGAAVAIMGRTEATLLDAKHAIHSFAGEDAAVEIVVGDALDETQVRHAFERAAALTDRLAIAVSVVGGGTMKPLLMFEPQDVMDDLQRNILSAFLLIRNAADEYGALGVRFNAIRPGFISTEIMEGISRDGSTYQSYLVNTPLGRVGEPDEIAHVVRFLLGPESQWMTGQILNVDGGNSLRSGPDYGELVVMMHGSDAIPGAASA